MRYLVFFTVLLILPLGSAMSDLTKYSEASYDSQSSHPALVEWFHGEGDEDDLATLTDMDRNGEITLLHWRTGASDEGGGLPDDDANSRLAVHGGTETPYIAIDGYSSQMDDYSSQIEEIGIRNNEVEIDWSIQLIGSTEVELLNITYEWVNPQKLKDVTMLHLFIIETDAVDSKGRTVKNLVRDWSPSQSFNRSQYAVNRLNDTITRDYLTGAGIELGDASHANEFEIVVALVGGFENDSTNRVLSLQRQKMPTYWQSVDETSILTPIALLFGLSICILFVVLAEKKRENGLPRLEGSWTDEPNVIEYRLVTGFSIEIGELNILSGWRTNSSIKKETVAANSTKQGKLKVSGSGDFSLKLAVKVDQLGDWILDLNLPDPSANN